MIYGNPIIFKQLVRNDTKEIILRKLIIIFMKNNFIR